MHPDIQDAMVRAVLKGDGHILLNNPDAISAAKKLRDVFVVHPSPHAGQAELTLTDAMYEAGTLVVSCDNSPRVRHAYDASGTWGAMSPKIREWLVRGVLFGESDVLCRLGYVCENVVGDAPECDECLSVRALGDIGVLEERLDLAVFRDYDPPRDPAQHGYHYYGVTRHMVKYILKRGSMLPLNVLL